MAMVYLKKGVGPELFLNHLVEGAMYCCQAEGGRVEDESTLRRQLVGRFHDILGEDCVCCGLSIRRGKNSTVGLWPEEGQQVLEEESTRENGHSENPLRDGSEPD
jgi:hypothetical protein